MSEKEKVKRMDMRNEDETDREQYLFEKRTGIILPTDECIKVYAQPYSLVLNELGQVAVVCNPCSAEKSDKHGHDLQLMRPVMLGLETATRCEKCGALGPMVSLWGDDECFGNKVILGGALKPYEMPEIWEEGSDYNGHV